MFTGFILMFYFDGGCCLESSGIYSIYKVEVTGQSATLTNDHIKLRNVKQVCRFCKLNGQLRLEATNIAVAKASVTVDVKGL